MYWDIRTMGQRCAVSGEIFSDGDEIFCFVCRLNEGEYSRCDVLARNADGFSVPGEIIGQWKRTFRSGEPDAKNYFQKLANAEEFFFSLFDGNETEEKNILKQLMALFLERGRILRGEKLKEKNLKKYVHVRSRREFVVPQKEFMPEEITSFGNILEMLI